MTHAERLTIIREYLTLVARVENPHMASARYLLEQGEVFAGRPTPPGFRMGKVKECYANAASLALNRPGMTYFEGYAVGRAAIPLGHAWVVDEAGQVIDTTWRPAGEDPSEWAYLGVGFTHHRLARALMAKGTYGLLDWPGTYEEAS